LRRVSGGPPMAFPFARSRHWLRSCGVSAVIGVSVPRPVPSAAFTRAFRLALTVFRHPPDVSAVGGGALVLPPAVGRALCWLPGSSSPPQTGLDFSRIRTGQIADGSIRRFRFSGFVRTRARSAANRNLAETPLKCPYCAHLVTKCRLTRRKQRRRGHSPPDGVPRSVGNASTRLLSGSMRSLTWS